jgi:hypothetical protein
MGRRHVPTNAAKGESQLREGSGEIAIVGHQDCLLFAEWSIRSTTAKMTAKPANACGRSRTIMD